MPIAIDTNREALEETWKQLQNGNLELALQLARSIQSPIAQEMQVRILSLQDEILQKQYEASDEDAQERRILDLINAQFRSLEEELKAMRIINSSESEDGYESLIADEHNNHYEQGILAHNADEISQFMIEAADDTQSLLGIDAKLEISQSRINPNGVSFDMTSTQDGEYKAGSQVKITHRKNDTDHSQNTLEIAHQVTAQATESDHHLHHIVTAIVGAQRLIYAAPQNLNAHKVISLSTNLSGSFQNRIREYMEFHAPHIFELLLITPNYTRSPPREACVLFDLGYHSAMEHTQMPLPAM